MIIFQASVALQTARKDTKHQLGKWLFPGGCQGINIHCSAFLSGPSPKWLKKTLANKTLVPKEVVDSAALRCLCFFWKYKFFKWSEELTVHNRHWKCSMNRVPRVSQQEQHVLSMKVWTSQSMSQSVDQSVTKISQQKLLRWMRSPFMRRLRAAFQKSLLCEMSVCNFNYALQFLHKSNYTNNEGKAIMQINYKAKSNHAYCNY